MRMKQRNTEQRKRGQKTQWDAMITIDTDHGRYPRRHTFCRGVDQFAVYEVKHGYDPGWWVTHVETGTCLPWVCVDKETALSMARRFDRIPWDDVADNRPLRAEIGRLCVEPFIRAGVVVPSKNRLTKEEACGNMDSTN